MHKHFRLSGVDAVLHEFLYLKIIKLAKSNWDRIQNYCPLNDVLVFAHIGVCFEKFFPKLSLKVRKIGVFLKFQNTRVLRLCILGDDTGGRCYQFQTAPRAGRNLDFFYLHIQETSKVVNKKTLSGECCMKPALIPSACWLHRIASSFVGLLHDRDFLLTTLLISQM